MLKFIIRTALFAVAGFWTASAMATTITIVNTDGPGVGLNDTTAVAATVGNPGTTLGAQALNVFQAAANYWETKLDSDVEILVDSSFAPLSCTTTSGVLGSAGPSNFLANWAGGTPGVADRFYAVALANSLAGVDLDPGTSDIGMSFNGSVGTPGCLTSLSWNYEIGVMPVSGGLDLLAVAIHELGHGLGFLTIFGPSNGFGSGFPTSIASFDDAYSASMFDKSALKTWSQMTPAERGTSSTNSGNLVWSGALATAESSFLSNGLNTGNAKLFAPNPYQPGSSNSHWDVSLAPNEIMEPSLTSVNEPFLTTKGFYDTGWQGTACLDDIVLPHDEWQMISIDCIPSGTNSIAALFGDDITGTYGTQWVLFSHSAATGVYTQMASTDPLQPDEGYWILQLTNAPVTLDIPLGSTRTPLPKPSTDADCESSLGCSTFALTSTPSTWHLLGNPYNTDIKFEDLRITADSGSCSLLSDPDGCSPAEASTADVFGDVAFSWDGNMYTVVTSSGPTTSLSRNTGYWVTTAAAAATGLNLQLHNPKDPYAGRLD